MPGNTCARARDLDRRARDVVCKSIIVEENFAVVLGGDVEVLREGTAGHENRTLLDADDVPGSVKVVCQSALI